MKRSALLIACLTLALSFSGCDQLNEISKQIPETATGPSQTQMASALKEALEIGAGKAVAFLNKEGGYLNNPKYKIPFPPEAQAAADKLRSIGFGDLVDKFVEQMNHGAENAAAEAKPIFVNSIQQMSLADARNIVLGNDSAATKYFEGSTRTELYEAFAPKITAAMSRVAAARYWSDITSTYNRIPNVKPIDTDLTRYATNKALDGLFIKVAEEEKDIRDNLAARTTSLLKEVFGWADTQKKKR